MAKHTLKVTKENRARASIDNYYRDAAWIWKDDATQRTVFDLWLHVVDRCTRLVEAVRRERPRDVMIDLADTMMWFLSFIAQLHNSKNELDSIFLFKQSNMPSDIIWNKYPGVCPACLDLDIISMAGFNFEDMGMTQASIKRNFEKVQKFFETRYDLIEEGVVKLARKRTKLIRCRCLSQIAFAEDRHKLCKSIEVQLDQLRLLYADQGRKLRRKKMAIDGLEDMFNTIFINSYIVYSLETIAFHLLEEVGEVTQALKNCYTFSSEQECSDKAKERRREKLREEIADVFSWVYAVMLKIRRVYYKDAQEYFKTLAPNEEQDDLMKKICLSKIIWAKYGWSKDKGEKENLFCPDCHSAPCKCEWYWPIKWSAAAKRRKKKE